jgi:hypothetical protein
MVKIVKQMKYEHAFEVYRKVVRQASLNDMKVRGKLHAEVERKVLWFILL